ncbi:MAG: hypothetical protein BWY75_03843 [bacterium ADurb.Bin425]|nr:MAG: hypothetical protein BWY75_03843 [bacterium ADurb.Bin425]
MREKVSIFRQETELFAAVGSFNKPDMGKFFDEIMFGHSAWQFHHHPAAIFNPGFGAVSVREEGVTIDRIVHHMQVMTTG